MKTSRTLYIYREGSAIQCFEQDGKLIMEITDGEKHMMKLGGLDCEENKDVFAFINHMNPHKPFERFFVKVKDLRDIILPVDEERIFLLEESQEKMSIADIIRQNWDSATRVVLLEKTDVVNLRLADIGKSVRLCFDLGSYFDLIRVA